MGNICSVGNPFSMGSEAFEEVKNLIKKSATKEDVYAGLLKIIKKTKGGSSELILLYLIEAVDLLLKIPRVVKNAAPDLVNNRNNIIAAIKGDINIGGKKTSDADTEKDSPEEIKELRENLYLDIYFGTMGSNAKNRFKTKVSNQLIFTILLDKSNPDFPRFLKNDITLNASINTYQLELVNTLKEYAKEFWPSTYKLIKDLNPEDENFWKYLNEKFFVKGHFNNNEFTSNILSVIDTDKNSIPKFKAAQALRAYITLRHFDSLMSDFFNKIVKIKDDAVGKYGVELKYSLDPSSSNQTNWRDDSKDYDELEEIGNLNQMLLLIFPTWSTSFKNGKLVIKKNAKMNYSLAAFTKGRLALWDLTYNLDLRSVKMLSADSIELINNIKTIFTPYLKSADRVADIILDLKKLTVSEAIAKMNVNPLEYAPIVLYILASNPTFDPSGKKVSFKECLKSSENFDHIVSMYRNIYDWENPDALIRYFHAEEPNNDFFKYINLAFSTILKNSLISYVYKPGLGVAILELQDKSSLKRELRLRNNLNHANSVIAPRNYRNITVDTEGLNGEINKYITIKSGDYTLYIYHGGYTKHNGRLIGETGRLVVKDKNNNTIPIDKNSTVDDFPDLFNVIKLVIGIKSSNDYNLIDTDIYTELTFDKLLKFASSILYRREVSRKVRELLGADLTKIKFLDTVAEGNYFNSTKEGIVPYSLQSGTEIELNVIGRRDVGIISLLSQALRYINGSSPENTARDSSNNLVGIASLSALYHKLLEQYLYTKDGSTSDFLVRHLIKGLGMIRDVKGLTDIKKATALNAKELYELSFLYDYYVGRYSFDNATKKLTSSKDPEILIMGMVISDKSNLEKIKIALNRPVKIYDAKGKATGEEKNLGDLTTLELENLIAAELGNYFEKVHDKIKTECDKINKALEEMKIPTTFNPDHNFEEWTDYINKNRGIITFDDFHNDLMHRILLQEAAKGNHLEISENLFGNFVKNSNKEIIAFESNHILYDILRRTGHWKKPYLDSTLSKGNVSKDDYFKLSLDLLISDLLYLNVDLDVSDKHDLIKSKVINYNGGELKDNPDTWIRKGKVGLLKLHLGDNTIVITSKQDFLNWKPYKVTLKQVEGTPDADYFNPNSDKFSVAKIIEKVNEIYPKTVIGNDILYQRDYLKKHFLFEARLDIATNPKFKLTPKIKKSIEDSFRTWLAGLGYDGEVIDARMAGLLAKLIEDPRGTAAKYYAITLASEKISKIKDSKLLAEIHKFNPDFKEIERNVEPVVYEINPEIIKHNLIDMYAAEEHTILAVGSHVNHPGATEAKRIGARVKRNVTESATKLLFDLTHLDSVAEHSKLIVIDDLEDEIYNTCGVLTRQPGYDGATFTCGVLSILENNSLGNARAGLNKKPFFHGINKYGQAFVIKTAGFDINNDMIRRSPVFERLNRRFLDIKWPIGEDRWDGNILKDFAGKDIDYGTFYYTDGKNHYMVDSNSMKYLGNGLYEYTRSVVSPTNPNEKINEETLLVSITSNYDLWKFFGGAYSESFLDGKLSAITDNTSMKKVALACGKVGTYKISTTTGKPYTGAISLNAVNLILKNSMIAYAVGAGAMKLGAANINSTDILYKDDDSWRSDKDREKNPNNHYEATTMTIDMRDSGILLDAEHHSEDSVLSLMTLVVNALGARGYTAKEAENVYHALRLLTHYALDEYFTGLKKYLNTGELEEFKLALSDLIVKTLRTTSTTDGLLLNAIAKSIKDAAADSKDKYSVILGKVPLSNASIFKKIMSGIASSMSKSAIKLKPPGSLAVLVPSNGLIQLYGDRFIDLYDFGTTDRSIIISKLREESKKNISVTSKNLNFELNYFLKDLAGNYYNWSEETEELIPVSFEEAVSIRIKNPIMYYEIIPKIMLHDILFLADNSVGHDLAASRIVFNSKDGEEFNIWDLDTVKTQCYVAKYKSNLNAAPENIRQLISNTLLEYGFKGDITSPVKDILNFLKLKHLLELDAIGSGNASKVYINNTKTYIDKDSVKVSNYELIAPKLYSEEFDLRKGDVVSEIVNNENFFLQRILEKFTGSCPDTYWDIAQRANNGKHRYLLYDDGIRQIPEGLTEVPLETMWIGNELWRKDINGNKMYKIPSKGDLPNIKIYKDTKGNEILVTNNLSFFLTLKGYIYTQLSTHITDTLGNSKDDGSEENILFAHFLGEIKKSTSNPKVNSLWRHLIEGVGDEASERLDVLDEVNNYSENEYKDLLKHEIRQVLKKRVNNLSKNIKVQLDELLKVLLNGDSILDYFKILKKKGENEGTAFVSHMIQSAKEIHTSFINSLNFLAARIPSQSQQSFMSMTVVGFDESGMNNTHVSRWQLYLQGSDFDIDKVSLLGTKYNLGLFETWSPYMSLYSTSQLEDSKNLDLPTGKEIEITDNENNLLDYLPKDYILTDVNGNRFYEGEKLKGTSFFLVYPKLDIKIPITLSSNKRAYVMTISGDYSDLTDLLKIKSLLFLKHFAEKTGKQFDLDRTGVSDEINEAYDVTLQALAHNSDFEIYASSILDPEDLQLIKNKKFRELYKKLNHALKRFAELVHIMNQMDSVEDGEFTREFVGMFNRHNKYQIQKEGLINYVSSYMYKVSESPSNYIQGLVSVDATTDRIKKIAEKMESAKKSLKFDLKSVTTRMLLLILTLSGKLNVGIAAASLKVFECISQYAYNVLNNGTKEELEALLFTLTIAGKQYNILANAHANDEGSIKSRKVDEVLLDVDQLEDAFLMISTYLSLAADNAKDPTLAKLNAGPDMLGLYTAGAMLNVPPESLADIIGSHTGLLILDKLSGDILTGVKKTSSIDSAVKALKDPSRNFPKTVDSELLAVIATLLNTDRVDPLPLKRLDGQTTDEFKDLILSALLKANNRNDIIKLIRTLSKSAEDYASKYGNISKQDLVKRKIKAIENNSTYKNFDYIHAKLLKKYDDSIGTRFEESSQKKLQEFEEKHNQLVNLLSEYKALDHDLDLGTDTPNNTIDAHLEILLKLNSDIFGKGWIKRREFKKSLNEISDVFEAIIAERAIWENDILTTKYIDENGIEQEVPLTDEDGNEILILDEIEKLSKISNEAQLVRGLLLNQSYANSPQDALTWIRKFESIVPKALPKDGELKTAWNALHGADADANDIALDIDMYIKNSPVEFAGLEMPYREAVKLIYDQVKTFINPFRVLDSVEHFQGYLDGMLAMYKGLSTISLLYRTMDSVSKEIVTNLGIADSATTKQVMQGVEKFILYKINRSFFATLNFKIPTESGLKVLTLNTPQGRAEFKKYMESTYIPTVISKYGSINYLLDHLQLIKSDRNTLHQTTVLYGLDETSMPSLKVLSEQENFLLLKLGLLDLKKYNILGQNVVGMLYLYNLVTTEGMPGEYNLTGIFEDLSTEELDEIGEYENEENSLLRVIPRYNKFISELDLQGEMYIDRDFTLDELYAYIAPQIICNANTESYLKNCKLKYVWILKPDTMKYNLYKYVGKSYDDDENDDNNPDNESLDIYDDLFGGSDEDESLGINLDVILNETGWELASDIKMVDSEIASTIAQRIVLNHGLITITSTIDLTSDALELRDSIMVQIDGGYYNLKHLAELSKLRGHKGVTEKSFIVTRKNLKTGFLDINITETENRLKTLLEDISEQELECAPPF